MANPIVNIILSAVDKTKAAFASAKGGITSIGDSAGNLKSVLGSIFTGLSVAGFIGQVKAAAEEMDNAYKSAQAAGTSVEKFSALSYASGQSGGGPEVLQKSLVKLNESLQESEDSSSKAAAIWRGLQLDPRQFKDSSDALLAIADRFAAMPDGIGKTNLAIDLFGEKIGPKMIPLLNEGRDGIKSLTDEAARLGKVLDTETAQSAERFNYTLDRLNARKVSLFAKTLPSLTQWVSALDDIIERGTSMERLAFFTTGFISEDVLNRISDAGTRVQDYNQKIFELQQQLVELRRTEGEASPNVAIWEKRIAELEKTRASLAKNANADRLADEKNTTGELGRNYEEDARAFKKANDEKISDAKRLQDALRTAFESALGEQKSFLAESERLSAKAAGGLTAGKSQDSLEADAAIAAMKLNRLASSSGISAEEIRAQAAAVRELAEAIDDQAQSRDLLQQADKGESVAARLQADEAGKQAAALAEQMRANEARMNEVTTTAQDINKTPIVPRVDGTQVSKLLADLADVEAAIGRVNGLKIAPGYGAGAVGDSMQEALRKTALQYGRRN